MTVIALVASLLLFASMAGGLTALKHKRLSHKPNYANIARLERELGFVLPEETTPIKALTQNHTVMMKNPYSLDRLSLGPGHVITVNDHDEISYLPAASAYYHASAGPGSVVRPREPRKSKVLDPSGRPYSLH